MVSFESEIAAERALADGEGVCWKSTERLEIKKATLGAATGGGIAQKMIEQHNVVDEAPEQSTATRSSVATSKNYVATAPSLSKSLPGMTDALGTNGTSTSPTDRPSRDNNDRKPNVEAAFVGKGVPIHAEEHLEKGQRLARRRSRRASVV